MGRSKFPVNNFFQILPGDPASIEIPGTTA
jgi:hypothetical protein